MSRKLRIDGYRVIVEVPCARRWARPLTPEEAKAHAESIARGIRHHLSLYHDACGNLPGVYQDAEPVCEFCGARWTEGADSEHNGGCCAADAAVMLSIETIKEEEAREAAQASGQFGVGA